MDELKLIGKAVGIALLYSSIWLIPLLIYRKVRGIPLIPEANKEPIDIKSRRERNRLIFTIVLSVGCAAYFFANGSPIMGGLCSFAGLFVLVWFEIQDRKLENR